LRSYFNEYGNIMATNLIIIIGLFILAIVSGMPGLGVAFAAVPFLSLFMPDLVHQVQPLTLLLNGLTGLFSAIGFARSGYVDWPKAIVLGAVAAVSAPFGSYLVQFINQIYIWPVYLAAVTYLTYNLFKPVKGSLDQPENFKMALILATPISILAGFLGVGPGFLLMPTLILLHFEPKRVAGINAFAITPPSFTAIGPPFEHHANQLGINRAAAAGGGHRLLWRGQSDQPVRARRPA
jgi:hypothetical protein